MKQEISALMDGELYEDEVENILSRFKGDSAARKNWAAYHLIGDVLRQPDHIHCDLSATIRDRMATEPTVFVPRGQAAKQKIRSIALSAAASVAAIGVVSWMSLQIGPEASPNMMMQQNAIRPAKAQILPSSNDYLLAHQEFSPSTDMSGGAYYIRTVSYSADDTQLKDNAGKR